VGNDSVADNPQVGSDAKPEKRGGKRPGSGKKTKRTPENRKKIIQALRMGQMPMNAARYAGMSWQTYNDWRKKDADFDAECEAALAELELGLLTKIEAAARDPKHWTAAAWKLERLFPERYRRRTDPVEVTGPNGTPLNVEGTINANLDQLSVEELKKLAGR
jgi:hypothetical protein